MDWHSPSFSSEALEAQKPSINKVKLNIFIINTQKKQEIGETKIINSWHILRVLRRRKPKIYPNCKIKIKNPKLIKILRTPNSNFPTATYQETHKIQRKIIQME